MRNTRSIGTTRRMIPVDKHGCVKVSRFSGWEEYRDIFHFSTTRRGGVSEGSFASMNPGLYTDDDPAAIRRNIELLADTVGFDADLLFMPRQVHKDRIEKIDAAFLGFNEAGRKARLDGVDALMTDLPGVCVAVATADCVPVLLYAPDRKAVAAVHAGWRGTVSGIARKTVFRMIEAYGCDPACMVAGIGPSIGPDAFEVGEEVVEAFFNAGMPMDRILRRNPASGKAHIDLWEANRWQLLEAGLSPRRIELAGICTYTCHTTYFSARRLGIRSGRILSGIGLEEKGFVK